MNALKSVEQSAAAEELTTTEVARLFAPSASLPTKLVYDKFIAIGPFSAYVEYRRYPAGDAPRPFIRAVGGTFEAGLGGFYGCIERDRRGRG